MQATDLQLLQAMQQPDTGASTLAGRVGTIASTSPVTALVDAVQIPCRQISGQTLTVGQTCVLITFGIGTKPLLIQTS